MANRRNIDWMRERLKLPISDVSENLISVTDIKQYLYCPRIIYFEKVLHVNSILDSQQEYSKERHDEYLRKELKRKDGVYYSSDLVEVVKLPYVHLCSKKLGVQGTIDLIIKTNDGEYLPIDYKNMKSNHGRIWMHHKYQLAAYALLIEDHFNTLVKRGFVNYIPEGTVKKLEITRSLKIYTNYIIKAIREIFIEEKLPHRKLVNCSRGCGYSQICRNQF